VISLRSSLSRKTFGWPPARSTARTTSLTKRHGDYVAAYHPPIARFNRN
jgi:hypothetical protein